MTNSADAQASAAQAGVMTSPARFLAYMLAFILAVAVVISLARETLYSAFVSNVYFNGFIGAVTILGIGLTLLQVFSLFKEVRYIAFLKDQRERYEADKPDSDDTRAAVTPRLLASLAAMLGERSSNPFSLSAQSLRTIIDGLEARIDEAHEINRYFIRLLVFLGLLGTFWGLLQTVAGISLAISALDIEGDLSSELFAQLRAGLQEPVGGMGTAFSSSLFGLGGSLILGFLALMSGHAYNRFVNELEIWLSSLAQLGSGSFVGGGESTQLMQIADMVGQTADSIERLQASLLRGEHDRVVTNNNLVELCERFTSLAHEFESRSRLAQNQEQNQAHLAQVLERLANLMSQFEAEETAGGQSHQAGE